MFWLIQCIFLQLYICISSPEMELEANGGKINLSKWNNSDAKFVFLCGSVLVCRIKSDTWRFTDVWNQWIYFWDRLWCESKSEWWLDDTEDILKYISCLCQENDFYATLSPALFSFLLLRNNYPSPLEHACCESVHCVNR